jgi:chemotaxis response regulator CheB
MRIAIVNDMPMAVEALRRALAFEPTHEVVWVAGNGAEAVRQCAQDTPDLILMDLIMPVMDGVEATRRIMAETPCAIVIVTVDRQQNVHRVFEAMGHGALDVVDTPALGAGNAQEAAAQDHEHRLADRRQGQPSAPGAGTVAQFGLTPEPDRHWLIRRWAGGAGSLAQGVAA